MSLSRGPLLEGLGLTSVDLMFHLELQKEVLNLKKSVD